MSVERAAETRGLGPVSNPANPDLLGRSLAFYTAFMQHSTAADPSCSVQPSDLGGHLFFPGELNKQSHPMVIAANVAGCATLVASTEAIEQKEAIRAGIVDFVVNSLDEALRILKNEIRKRATVAVCIAISPAQAQDEMVERGVVPQLLAHGTAAFAQRLALFGLPASVIYPVEPAADQVILTWSVLKAPAQWMLKLDAIATECLGQERAMLRWVRLSPRFAGRVALFTRTIYCGSTVASSIVLAFKKAVETGAIAEDVNITLHEGGELRSFVCPAMRAG